MRTTIKLPIETGDKVLVEAGDEITPKTVLVQRRDKTDDKILHVSTLLSVKASFIHKYLKKKLGEEVASGEVIVEKKGWWSSVSVKSPLTGRIKNVDLLAGTITVSPPDSQSGRKITIPVTAKVTHVSSHFLELAVMAPVLTGEKGEGEDAEGKMIYYPGDVISIFDLDDKVENNIVLIKKVDDEQLVKLDVLGCKAIVALKLPADIPIPFLKLSEDKFIKLADHDGKNVWLRPKDKQLFIID